MTQHAHSSLGFPLPINCNNCVYIALDIHLKTKYLDVSIVFVTIYVTWFWGVGLGGVCVLDFIFKSLKQALA